MAQEVLGNHEPNTLSLVILSQVDRALALFQQLQNNNVSTRLLHSRFRQGDREQLTAGLLKSRGILVSTQVVEAGVDLSARKLYTDLCSWASFVQRAGRCGRHEKRYPSSDIYWIRHEPPTERSCMPYTVEDCTKTAETLQQLPDASISTLLELSQSNQCISGPVLTEDMLEELFDTHPRSSSSHDVQKFIREKSDRNCAVAWFAGESPLDTWQPAESELCSVPISKLKQFTGFIWNEFEDTWKGTKENTKENQLSPGNVFALPVSAGGYSAITGWTGNPTDIPTLLEKTGVRDRYHDDRSTQKYGAVSLAQHSLEVRQEMQRLIDNLSFELPEELLDIAQWHDLGKAHWVFQSALGNPHPIGAKGKFEKRYKRRGFRHELASALSALYHGKPFYFAYLVATHHGKVRGTIESMPYEKGTYRRGIEPGEGLPETELGGGLIVAPSKLEVPAGDAAGWWKGEVRKLIETLGLFRLAYLETIIRVADAQASTR